MSRFWGRICAVGLCILLSHFDALQAADEQKILSVNMADIEGGLIVANEKARGQSATETEIDGRKYLQLDWDSGLYPYMEIILKKPVKLPEFAAAKAKLTVDIPAGSKLNSVGLRLLDSSNEVFQFSARVDRKTIDGLKEGQHVQQIFEYELSNRTVQGSWGGNNNKVLDMPVRFFGFGVDYLPKTGKSSAALGDFSIELLPDTRVSAVFPVYDFTSPEGWKAQYPGGSGEVTLAKDGLMVESKAQQVVLRETKWMLINYPRFSGLKLKAELLSGEASAVAVVQGQHGKRATTPEVKLTLGKNEILLDTTGKDFNSLSGEMKIVAVKINTPQKNAQLNLNELGAERLVQPLEAVTMDVETGTPVHVMRVGTDDTLIVNLANHAVKPVAFTAGLSVKADQGNAVRFQKDFALEAGQAVQWQPEFKPARYDLYRVQCDISEQSKLGKVRPLTMQKTFAYMKPSGPTEGRAKNFLFSISTHTEHWSEGEQDLEIMAAGLCGAKVMRTGPVWTQIEPQQGVFRWQALDRLVKGYAVQGMELQYILMFPPRWAAPENLQKSSNWKDIMSCAPRSEPWKDFVRALCERYKGQMRFYEIWNEPDLNGFAKFSSTEYVRLMKEAYQTAKEVDPQAQIMTGGFATLTSHGGRTEMDFQKNALKLAKGYFDIHAYHEHGTADAYYGIVDRQFLPLRKETGADNKPWYANETAITSLWVGEKKQAETLFQKLIFAWSRGAIGYTWYDLRNDGFSVNDPEHSYGLLTNDFYPKPVYVAYNALAGEYAGARFIKELEGKDGLWAFLFQDDQDMLVAAWKQNQAAARNLLIKTDAVGAEKIDLMGNRSPLKLYEGYVLVDYDTEPVSVRLKGAESAEEVNALVAVEGQQYLMPADTSKLKIRIHNPFANPQQVRLSVGTPNGVVASKNILSVNCGAGAEQELEIDLTAQKNFEGVYGKSYPLRIGYALDAAGWRGSLTANLSCAVVIPKRDGKDKAYDFVLDSSKNLVSLFANDPNNKHLVWSGKSDLQARARLTLDNGRLMLKVLVEDDKHSQPFDGADIWKGDSVQFAIQKNGAKKYWEIGLASAADGKAVLHVWSKPDGGNPQTFKYSVGKTESGMEYDIALPIVELGLNEKDLHEGVRFNLLVNDNDEGKREGWLHIAPHLGESKNPALFPLVIFE